MISCSNLKKIIAIFFLDDRDKEKRKVGRFSDTYNDP